MNAKQTNQRNDRRRVQGFLELYEKGKRNEKMDYERLYEIKENEAVIEKQ